MPTRPPSESDVPQLGDLEVAALEHLWSKENLSAKDVYEAIGISRGISLNTVQSALERLYRKGLLERVKKSHAYRYRTAVRREQLVARLIGDVVGRFQGDPSLALAAFIETSEDIDPKALDRLQAVLRDREKERGE